MENELKHYGVKGMKWGVRRSRQLSSSDYKNIKKATDETKRIVDETNRYTNSKKNNEKRKKILTDLDEMSDDELRVIVNRLNMEERYASVMNSREANTGRVETERLLDALGTTLAIGSSALSIMLAMKELRK